MAEISAPARLRARARSCVDSNFFQRFIIIVIMSNAIVLGLETSKAAMDAFGTWLIVLDTLALTIFIIEILLKLYAMGFSYFRDPWNIFDFTIVAIALLPISEGFSVLRALRVLRAFRLISMVPKMRLVVQAFLKAIPGMGSIMLLMSLVFYVFAVMATKLFGNVFDEWFGSVGMSLYSLFQIMTLESWSMGIVRPVMEQFPLAWAFFIPFILITTFAVLNLFIAIVVNSMQEVQEEDENSREERLEVLTAIQALHEEIAELRKKQGD